MSTGSWLDNLWTLDIDDINFTPGIVHPFFQINRFGEIAIDFQRGNSFPDNHRFYQRVNKLFYNYRKIYSLIFIDTFSYYQKTNHLMILHKKLFMSIPYLILLSAMNLRYIVRTSLLRKKVFVWRLMKHTRSSMFMYPFELRSISPTENSQDYTYFLEITPESSVSQNFSDFIKHVAKFYRGFPELDVLTEKGSN